MAAVMLRPTTSGVQFTARSALRLPSQITYVQPDCLEQQQATSRSRSPAGSCRKSSPVSDRANPNLTIIEIEALLRERVHSKADSLQQAFQSYDIDQTRSVTREEFRRVLESFCFPVTSDQFEALMNKVKVNRNGMVNYGDFLAKFHVNDGSKSWKDASARFMHTQSTQEMSTDMLEKFLREKLQDKLKDVVKSLRLYDYNRDGYIPRHELRKVLESCCCRMTDQQFDKLCARYDLHHLGVINYREFLRPLGINLDRACNTPHVNNSGPAVTRPHQEVPARSRNIGRPDNSELEGLNFDQIELNFRKKMKTNYANLKRIFLAFDKNLDGTVAIDDLKSILTHFTLPMTDQLFQQLMERCGVRGTVKISWELFLKKFQDPLSVRNGQTIPIKPGHKFFPLRGADEKADLKTVVQMLQRHVEQAFVGFRNAFMELDKNRDGRITRKDLWKVIESFKVRISEAQFQQLMILLDPNHTNCISYHNFLNLFEERETQEGHKWLKSCHRFNDVQKPVIMAWETVEGILRDRVTNHWEEVSNAISYADRGLTGMIPPKALRRILEQTCLPLSDDHYQDLLTRMQDQGETKSVNYLEFFSKLGVSVRPGDIGGLSTQIQRASDHTEAERLADLDARNEEMDVITMERTEGMSPEEIIVRLKDRATQHSTQICHAFRRYDKNHRGQISKRAFRQVLESFGFYMTDNKFQDLCSQLQFHRGCMDYMAFLENFEDSRFDGPGKFLANVRNHKVNEIRGDEYGLSALEVESKLRSKLRENFEDLRGAFYKFDESRAGALTKKNFRRMLDAFTLVMCENEFEVLCRRLGITSRTRITYTDFLDRFEIRDTQEGHKWLNSVHRYNKTKPMRLLSAEEVHEILAQKAHRQWGDLSKAFRSMDTSGSGVVTKRELRETLYKFILPMKKEEFLKLWNTYDSEGKGYMTHQDILRCLTGMEFAPADDAGTSKQIVDNSCRAMEEHHQNQQAKHEQITYHQAAHAEFLTVDELMKQLKDRIRDQHTDFHAAFKSYDKGQKGYLSVLDIQSVLLNFNYYLDDDQFFDLLDRLGLRTRNSKLRYDGFLRVFEEGRKDQHEQEQEEPGYPRQFPGMEAEQAEEKMRAKVAERANIVRSAFQAFDKEYTGQVKLSDFRRVLDNFCFKLTDAQFKHLKASLTLAPKGMVDYVAYMDSLEPVLMELENPEKWLESKQHCLQEPSAQVLTLEEVQQYLREIVTAKFYPLAKAFEDVDYARIGVISRDDFRDILKKFAIQLTEEQFENLWSASKVNDFGNLSYRDFLQRFCEHGGPPPHMSATPSASWRRPATADSGISRTSARGSMRGLGRPYTPLVDASSAETKLKDKLRRYWKDIQKQCRLLDPENTGIIGQEDFRYLVSRYDLSLSEDDMQKLLLKYDVQNNDTFCYMDFLRHLVLSSRTSQQQPLLNKRKLRQASAAVGFGPASENLDDATASLRQCVLENWKGMRREFRALDPAGSGHVSTLDFRQILRNYNINLEEEVFLKLVSPKDRYVQGTVDYNRFIQGFLRSV